MFRLIGMIVVALAIVAAIGWYRGWFHVETHNEQGVHQVDVTVNKTRVDQDKAKVQQDVHNLEPH